MISLKEHLTFFKLEIEGQGTGIPKRNLQFIFDEFYQIKSSDRQKSGGFGLGLSIAQRLSSKLDVSFTIESEFGEYTLARLEIPK